MTTEKPENRPQLCHQNTKKAGGRGGERNREKEERGEEWAMEGKDGSPQEFETHLIRGDLSHRSTYERKKTSRITMVNKC